MPVVVCLSTLPCSVQGCVPLIMWCIKIGLPITKLSQFTTNSGFGADFGNIHMVDRTARPIIGVD